MSGATIRLLGEWPDAPRDPMSGEIALGKRAGKRGGRYFLRKADGSLGEFHYCMTPSSVGARTPWGRASRAYALCSGVLFFTTPGHGGVWLSPTRRGQMPKGKQRAWFEEDCESKLPMFVFWLEIEKHQNWLKTTGGNTFWRAEGALERAGEIIRRDMGALTQPALIPEEVAV